MIHLRKLIALTFAATLALAGCSTSTPENPGDTSDEGTPGADAGDEGLIDDSLVENLDHLVMSDEELAALPKVVATVDGAEVPREQFLESYRNHVANIEFYGLDGAEDATAESIVTSALDDVIHVQLLLNAAAAEGIEASDAQIDEKILEMAGLVGAESIEEFVADLAERGTSEEKIRGVFAQQILIENYFDAKISVPEPTDEEILAYYEELLETLRSPGSEDDSGLPSLETIRDDLIAEMTSGARNDESRKLVEALRATAAIEIFI